MRKILIACQCASNKGDRAIAEYLIAQLKKESDIEITLSTTDPTLWCSLSEQGVKVIGTGYRTFSQKTKNSFLIRVLRNIDKILYDVFIFPNLIKKDGKHKFCNRISKKFIEEVKSSDVVIVTGGHHITSIRNKNALFSITYDIGLISLYAKKYILWSQTIGPLDFSDERAKIFIGNIIKNAEKVYIRDENSLKCIEDIYGNSDNLVKSYDSVFGFGNKSFPQYADRKQKVGVAIFNGLKKAFDTYDVLAQMLDRYASLGYDIEFFRMEYDHKEESDIRSVISKMKVKGNVSVFAFTSSTIDHLNEVASCKLFVGYKTHSIIMALTTGTPLIAIAYHQKSIDFMKSYGLDDYAILDEELTIEKVLALMDKLSENAESIHLLQKESSYALAEQIQNDFMREMDI